MRKGNSFYDVVDQVVSYGVQKGILHLYNEDESFYKNTIVLSGHATINFGSCSYLGLEFDDRLKKMAKEAIDSYGTQFSESRAYVSLKLYKELESLLAAIFEAHVIVTPTTTLGHIAAIPVVVGDGDAVIMDHQVHNSIQTAVTLLKPRGIHVEILRHSRMDLLEERIKLLGDKYDKIWYMADGVYSMFGDGCPVRKIYDLMERYRKFHFYADDAHGMSIYGKHGRGYLLDGRQLHTKMIMATSLNKAFASGGGVLLFADKELARKVRACGGPLITSGPMQPAALGAAVAAAKIHLSGEIYEMQAELAEKRKFARKLLEEYALPIVSRTNAAVFFIGAGLPKVGYNLVDRMLKAGYYVNLGVFPAVPMKQTGIRFTITRLHRFSQIEAMITDLADAYPKAVREEGSSLQDVCDAFKIPWPGKVTPNSTLAPVVNNGDALTLCHYNSIKEVNRAEWDALFAGKGSFDWQGLQSLEACFTDNPLPEDNWLFDYVVIKSSTGEIIVATFLTTALWKDDMLSPGEVSRQVEDKRRTDPYYLVSKVIATGSLLTEGEHLYINRNARLWQEATHLLLEKINVLQDQYHAERIVLRDFQVAHKKIDDYMIGQGYFRIDMPDTNIVLDMSWNDYYSHLSRRSRQHYREDVRKYQNDFKVSVIQRPPSEAEVNHWYELYQNVKNHTLELNTFPLPRKIFSTLLTGEGWEVLQLELKSEGVTDAGKPVAMVVCYQSEMAYVPMIIGLDYALNRRYRIYRQALYRLVMRAKALGKQRIHMGFAATTEKKKVGATALKTFAYVQNKDSYNMEIIEGLNRGEQRPGLPD
ncbi:MAG TPA: aminotransferase class I/II-fold pyridoxal phosphate-dependent enzyme [Chitinophagaceae bacterium]|nr:aminotransferase class I/II-fold pyridoxal phosphate-dependent enzyme [Chitinophagaceae bacterium]